MIPQELTVRITLSPLQWGEKPGSLRFSIHTTSEKISIGSFSVSGIAAYQLREMAAAEMFLSARVMCRGHRNFVLTQLMGPEGWVNWKDAIAIIKKPVEHVLAPEASLPSRKRQDLVTQIHELKA